MTNRRARALAVLKRKARIEAARHALELRELYLRELEIFDQASRISTLLEGQDDTGHRAKGALASGMLMARTLVQQRDKARDMLQEIAHARTDLSQKLTEVSHRETRLDEQLTETLRQIEADRQDKAERAVPMLRRSSRLCGKR